MSGLSHGYDDWPVLAEMLGNCCGRPPLRSTHPPLRSYSLVKRFQLVPFGSQWLSNFKVVTEWQNFATLWILYYIDPRHTKRELLKKNGPLTVRLTVWFDAPPLMRSDFCGVSLILYYDYTCSETELHKKEVISIQQLLSPIPIYLLFYANKITRTTKQILLILHAELSVQRFIWDIL